MKSFQVLFDSIEIKPRYLCLVVEVEIRIDHVRLIARLFFLDDAVPQAKRTILQLENHMRLCREDVGFGNAAVFSQAIGNTGS
jgi:hypothetical protein